MKHLTLRVAWHDHGWNGAVCVTPTENSYCLALDRIHEKRDDAYEQSISETPFAALAPTDLPPCSAESGAFMSPADWTREIQHPYQEIKDTQNTHGHLRPTDVRVPAHSTFAIPFDWMRRVQQRTIQDALAEQLPEDEEPPFKNGSTWVFGRRRQEALLNLFFSRLVKDRSLVFFYTKAGQPISDAISRLVVGVGRITKIGQPLEYESVGSKRQPPVWDRIVHHSIRSDESDGFLLPYHEYLEPTGDPDEDERRRLLLREIAVTPEPAHVPAFSYFSEHASPDIALSTLVKCLDAVRRVRQHGIAAGPWEAREDWLNEQIAKTWIDRGAFPGLGSVLEALGMRLGTALALELIASGIVGSDEDPWPCIDDLMRRTINAPNRAYEADLETVRSTWAKLTPQRRGLLELLSRFALTVEQAKRWFDVKNRNAATSTGVTDQEVVQNPYRIAECDLGDTRMPAVSLGAIDRGLFPDDAVAAKCPVPEPSRVDSTTDHRRVRGAVVTTLRRAADEGDSLLSAVEVLTRIDRLDLARPCVVPLDWFPGNEAFLKGVVRQFDVEITVDDRERLVVPGLQLDVHADTEQRLANRLLKRAAKHVNSPSTGWRDLLIAAITESGVTVDLEDARHVDALADQERALERITSRRLGVLVGRAGTGKTSVLGALVRCHDIATDGVLLLAPTGKARVRLQRSTRREAQTIAQFLYRLGRYDGARQRPRFHGKERHRKEKTVVVDECSMLTMDDLFALLEALDLGHVERLILVGDPNQLPPIGVGRPFADLIGVLDEPSNEAEHAGVDALARLTVEVRTTEGETSDALRLAAWFTNESQPKDADRVLSDLELGEEFNDLEITTWRTPEELRLRITEQLESHLGLSAPDDIAAFDRFLGLTEEGWVPFGDHDGAERFQVLSPVRMHAHGVHDLNRWFQRRFRPLSRWGKTLGDEQIGRKDKVIQLRNGKRTGWSKPTGEQEEYLANGEIGTIATAKNGFFNVAFAGRPQLRFGYRGSSFGEDGGPLELAYALTVHKAQGSDFGVVFFVLPKTTLLSRELVYTGLTRPKKKLVLLVEGDDATTLYDFTLPERSETARRNPNLFRSAVREDAEQAPYAEHLIHRLSDGRMVRSKSELAIAIELQRQGLWGACQYERVLEGTGRPGRLRPDFTFIDAAGDPLVWEHLGMLAKRSYRESWEWKLQWYADNGFELGTNLFTSEDAPDGGLDQNAIAAVGQRIAGEL